MKKIAKALLRELIYICIAVFIMWVFASWYDVAAHNGPNGDLNFWKYNIFILLTEMR